MVSADAPAVGYSAHLAGRNAMAERQASSGLAGPSGAPFRAANTVTYDAGVHPVFGNEPHAPVVDQRYDGLTFGKVRLHCALMHALHML